MKRLDRCLVFLGHAGGSDAVLFHEDRALAIGDELSLRRRRSPWNPAGTVDRVIIGTSPDRADVLLRGPGLAAEHVRVYLPREGEVIDLLPMTSQATRVGEEPLEAARWRTLLPGEEIQLGPWRFRYRLAS